VEGFHPLRTESTDTPAARRTPPADARFAALLVGLGAILVVMLALFILPSLKSGPHDLPLGLIGDPAATGKVEQALEAAAPGAWVIESYDSADDLAEAIRDRSVVGGLVATADRIDALVASAGSTAISGALTATATALAGTLGTTVAVTDVVPLPAGDPTGVGIGGLAFPLVFGGIVPVAAFRALFPRHAGWRYAGLAGFAVVGGVIVAAVLRFWFGSIEGAFWPVAGAMALGIAGLALPLAGFQELFGGKGFTIAAASMMFLGNPFAGIATTGAWLPAGVGLLGQLLPPGATGTLVRSVAYFGAAGGLAAGLTLAAWVAVGILLAALGLRRLNDLERYRDRRARP